MGDGSAGFLADAARRLADGCDGLVFSDPVSRVYNPLRYARWAHEAYLHRYAGGGKRVIFVGMNPGPWGMAQTGVPFGEVAAVVDWLGIEEPVGEPGNPHPARPIHGFTCLRSEVSGRRFWGLMRERFGTAELFFQEHFVANYCPLLFLEESGRNRTPDRLKPSEKAALFRLCDAHLRETIRCLEPEWVIGIGRFAEARIRSSLSPVDDAGIGEGSPPKIAGILHPSPASPRANRGWGRIAAEELRSLGVWC